LAVTRSTKVERIEGRATATKATSTTSAGAQIRHRCRSQDRVSLRNHRTTGMAIARATKVVRANDKTIASVAIAATSRCA
jgi:hypothetical protein